jgi:preprotein translocase subunit SecD
MTRNNKILLLIIVVIFAFTVWVVYPLGSNRLGRNGLRLGLDLVGGVQLIYQAEFSANTTTADVSSAMDRAVLTIQKRIDAYGVTEPIIQKLGENRIMIQLPGFTDIQAAKSLVEQTGFLEFREAEKNSSGTLVYLKDYLAQSQLQFFDTAETGNRIFTASVTDSSGKTTNKTIAYLTSDNGTIKLTDGSGNVADNTTLAQYGSSVSWIPARGTDGTQLTGAYLADAQAIMDTSTVVAKPAISIKWNAEGSVIFDQIAARLHNPAGTGGAYSYEYALGIFLDNNLLSAPQLTSASYGGAGTISGSFTLAEAQTMANLLKSGALPVKLESSGLANQSYISATLGARFIDLSKKAGLVGILLVMFYMIVYYRLPGVLASLALIFYGSLSLMIFKLIPVTLSLAGLGGFIASLGMAVDANVLIFERMKEELRLGRTLGAGVEAGFHRAWSAIRDSNLTTVLACVILYWLGSTAVASSAVKGFALTLAIGVIISMFTAITVTRTFLRTFVGSSLSSNSALFYSGGKKK